MKRRVYVAVSTLLVGLSLGYTVSAQEAATSACDATKSAWCVLPRTQKTLDTLAGATVPKLATPDWLNPPASASQPRVVSYSISTRGAITADMDEFRSIVAATYADSRGWTRLGVSFQQVDSGGQFTVFLSEASQMTSFSASGCDTTYSCNVGRAVVINQDRWLGGSPAWNDAGGDLASYRNMVINHETGHWLGHGHRQCGGAGQQAPVMQQQSLSMQGCEPNAWPLSAEMYSPTLGIRS